MSRRKFLSLLDLIRGTPSSRPSIEMGEGMDRSGGGGTTAAALVLFKPWEE